MKQIKVTSKNAESVSELVKKELTELLSCYRGNGDNQYAYEVLTHRDEFYSTFKIIPTDRIAPVITRIAIQNVVDYYEKSPYKDCIFYCFTAQEVDETTVPCLLLTIVIK